MVIRSMLLRRYRLSPRSRLVRSHFICEYPLQSIRLNESAAALVGALEDQAPIHELVEGLTPSLLAYLEGLAPHSRTLLQDHCGESIIPLSSDDARLYAANGFGVACAGKHHLILPECVSSGLISDIKRSGIVPVLVDVGEFLKKGGGSVKCMIGDLGELCDDEDLLPPEVAQFRKERDYRTIYGTT